MKNRIEEALIRANRDLDSIEASISDTQKDILEINEDLKRVNAQRDAAVGELEKDRLSKLADLEGLVANLNLKRGEIIALEQLIQ